MASLRLADHDEEGSSWASACYDSKPWSEKDFQRGGSSKLPSPKTPTRLYALQRSHVDPNQCVNGASPLPIEVPVIPKIVCRKVADMLCWQVWRRASLIAPGRVLGRCRMGQCDGVEATDASPTILFFAAHERNGGDGRQLAGIVLQSHACSCWTGASRCWRWAMDDVETCEEAQRHGLGWIWHAVSQSMPSTATCIR